MYFRAKENGNSEVEEFDQTAAFFTKVVSKKKKVISSEQSGGGKGKSKGRDGKGKDDDVSQMMFKSENITRFCLSPKGNNCLLIVCT